MKSYFIETEWSLRILVLLQPEIPNVKKKGAKLQLGQIRILIPHYFTSPGISRLDIIF